MRATPSDLRILTPLPLPEAPVLCAACEANNCTEPATATDPAGEGVCQFHAEACDSDHAAIKLDTAGFCAECDGTREIPLTHGLVATVDAADYEALARWKWYASRHQLSLGVTWYAARRAPGERTYVYMHRALLEAPRGVQVDHRDGNGLNNVRANLRLATVRENQRNRQHHSANKTSRFRGVCWYEQTKRWHARIHTERGTLHLGYFLDETSAARAYDVAARRHFGEFASPNDTWREPSTTCDPITISPQVAAPEAASASVEGGGFESPASISPEACDCGQTFNADGVCPVCDVCHCSSVDRETGYTECRVHATAANDRPAGDLMAALKTAMGRG